MSGEPSKIVALHAGCAGKAQLLEDRLMAVIFEDQFADMTLAEILGVIECMKLTIVVETAHKLGR